MWQRRARGSEFVAKSWRQKRNSGALRGWVSAFVAIFASAIALSGCSEPSFKYRYRLTINVNVDGRTKTGSSVVQVAEYNSKSIDGNYTISRQSGEAAVVDLGGGRVVAVLLNRSYDPLWPIGTFGEWQDQPTAILLKAHSLPLDKARRSDPSATALAEAKGVIALTPNQMPPILTFRNRLDPHTVVPLDPEHFDQVFGAGVKLESVTVEVTDAPITHDLIRVFPWISQRDVTIGGVAADGKPVKPSIIQFRSGQ